MRINPIYSYATRPNNYSKNRNCQTQNSTANNVSSPINFAGYGHFNRFAMQKVYRFESPRSLGEYFSESPDEIVFEASRVFFQNDEDIALKSLTKAKKLATDYIKDLKAGCKHSSGKELLNKEKELERIHAKAMNRDSMLRNWIEEEDEPGFDTGNPFNWENSQY